MLKAGRKMGIRGGWGLRTVQEAAEQVTWAAVSSSSPPAAQGGKAGSPAGGAASATTQGRRSRLDSTSVYLAHLILAG